MANLTHPKQAIYYLLERGHIAPKMIVDGDIVASETSSRHKNIAVTNGSNAGYFLKSVQPQMAMAAVTLQREAALYLTIQQDAEMSFLSGMMPKLHSYDPQRGILVIEHVPNSENLTSYHRRVENLPENIAVKLGNTLGVWHSGMHEQLKSEARRARFALFLPAQIPWAFLLHQMSGNNIPNLNFANSQMLGILNRYSDFPATLDALRISWQSSSLVHGDMKFENCLISFPNGETSEPVLKIIDWEIADFGDPLWDIGGVLQSYLSLWVNASVKEEGTIAVPFPLGANRPNPNYSLGSIQRPLRAFWNSYSDTVKLIEDKKKSFLERSLQYAAARMIQTVFEVNFTQPTLALPATALLQVSLNILLRPSDAVELLLGF